MKTLTGQRNQCQGCLSYFNSNYAFDKHRTGEHGKDRRCMTTEEMLEHGMALNSAGFWVGNPQQKSWTDQEDEEQE
jgi:hypothetical protein